MSRPRVLHIGKYYPPYKGGMETHLQELCRATSKHLDLEVIVANDSTQTITEFDGSIRVHRVGTLASVSSAPICPGMVRAIRNTPADIIHFHAPNPAAALAYFASRHPARLVVTHQSDIIRQRVLKFFYEPLLRRLMQRASAIICLSPNYIESSAILGRHRDKCNVIPHGLDPEQFGQAEGEEISAIRDRYGSNLVLAVGRLVYYKGFDYLIRAVAHTDATLLIIGAGPLRDHLLRIATGLGIAGRVYLLGEVPDVRPYYRAARVFALPSIARSEAFGIVQLEAMASGTPVVNTNLDSGVPFVSLNGVSGITVPARDAEALSEALNRLLHDDLMHRRMSEGARFRVREMFTLSTMANRTVELYRQVLGTKEKAAALGWPPLSNPKNLSSAKDREACGYLHN